MDDQVKSFFGCLGLIAIALMVAVGLRSQDMNQFLLIGGFVVGALILLLAGLSLLFAGDNDTQKYTGAGCGFVGVVLAIAAGSFLITGNFDQSIKIAKVWEWGQTPPTPAAVAQTQATQTPVPPPTATLEPTATPIAQPTGVVTTSPATVSITQTKMITQSLNEIWKLTPEDAAKEATALTAAKDSGLLIGAAFEHAGDRDSARATYKQVTDGPYATSASFRSRVLDNLDRSSGEKDTLYQAIANEPVAEGWFLIGDQWQWDNTQRAAWHALVELRGADQLSFQFFQYLHTLSLFPPSYAYLFILLTLMIGVRILALPLQVRAAHLSVQVSRLNGDIQAIRTAHSDDAMAMNQAIQQLYKDHGINMWGGCMVAMVDLIFVIWALVALGSFSPQLALDRAQFWTVADVTRFDLGIALAWVGVSLVQTWFTVNWQQTGQTVGQVSCGFLLSGAIFVVLAWYFRWPAYGFIFWILLAVVGLIINKTLTAIMAATQ